jgi:FkbM family methyltransferase
MILIKKIKKSILTYLHYRSIAKMSPNLVTKTINNFYIFTDICFDTFFGKHLQINIVLSYLGKKFTVDTIGEIGILHEVFIKKEYEISHKKHAATFIFDIGANIGCTSIFFAIQYPNSIIYAFEPNPFIYSRLHKNVSQFKNIIPVCAGISGETKIETLYIHKQMSQSSSLQNRGDSFQKVTVAMYTLDDIINTLHVSEIDILKIDAEGAEYEILKETKQLHRVNQIIGEVHEDLMKQTKEDVVSILNNTHKCKVALIRNNRFTIHAIRKKTKRDR